MTAICRAALVALCLTLASPAPAETLNAELRHILDRFRRDYGFPGATAAIASPDGQISTVASGIADLESGTPMTPGTRMLAASIGKSFVALIVLSLENDGVLARSDHVSGYLGNRTWFSRLPNHATMTVADLLRHTAGLPDHVHQEAFQAEMAARTARAAPAMTAKEALGFVFDADPLFPAGAAWAYSDTGYLLLGLLIEEASGASYYDLLYARLLKPLGLDATAPSNSPTLPGLAVGYVAEDNAFGLPTRTMDYRGNLRWDPAVEWTGGGLISTSQDLAAWGHALFRGNALTAPYLDRLLDSVPVSPDDPDTRYGAGVAIHADSVRGTIYGHRGWIPGYVSSLRHYPDHGVTIAFQINTDVGIADAGSDLLPALEASLGDLAIAAHRSDQR